MPTNRRRELDEAPAGDRVRLTVDQVARLAGTTTRNVRAFQTLGLLPRPTLDGRTGLYRQEHLDRLRAILRLQRAGFSLGAIGSLFTAWEQGLTLAQVLGVPTPSAPAGPVSVEGPDAIDAFEDWPALRSVAALAVVPTTVLDQRAS
ncbi:MAG TPA: MerR family transcriptional regulator [Acidimicrobiales bacterium]|nr:MerR family transcriptional regulator [Acidimicrobiales bacterium]